MLKPPKSQRREPMEERIQLSMKESKRISVLEELRHGKISQAMAAERLGITSRQVRRIFKRYKGLGATGLAHKNRGKQSPKKIPKGVHDEVVEIIRLNYPDFGPVLAQEMLEERHEIKLSRETVRQIMIRANIHTKKWKRSKHRKWRKPKDCEGEMQQLDGSFHDWFEGRASWCWLIRFTDDATGKFVYGQLVTAESYKAVATATKNNFEKNGLPNSLYTDKGKVFKVNVNNDDDELITQYERALEELNVGINHAHSPQAKGRVERNFKTDQDRLVKMLRINNISTIEEANKYLQEVYIPKYNSKFSRPALNPNSVYRSSVGINFENIFCIREERKVRNDWTFSYKGRMFQILDCSPAIVKPKDRIHIFERLNGSIFIKRDSTMLKCIEISQRPVIEREPKPLKAHKPAKNNPWRKSNHMLFTKRGHFHSAQK